MAFLQQQWFRERASTFSYTYRLSCNTSDRLAVAVSRTGKTPVRQRLPTYRQEAVTHRLAIQTRLVLTRSGTNSLDWEISLLSSVPQYNISGHSRHLTFISVQTIRVTCSVFKQTNTKNKTICYRCLCDQLCRSIETELTAKWALRRGFRSQHWVEGSGPSIA
jgi:hypothetical protein